MGDNDKLLKEYFMTFGEMPLLLQTMSYENEKYQKLMKKAIENQEPITEESLDNIGEYDLDIDEKQQPKGEEPDMEKEKIKKLLKVYGAEDNEIKNFIHDLYEDVEEAKEEDGKVDKFDSREIILKNLKKDFNFDNDEDLQKLVLNKLGK